LRPPRPRPLDPDADLGSDRLDILSRFLELLEERARRRRIEAMPGKSSSGPPSRAAWVRQQCPDIEAARAAFETFAVPAGQRVRLPATAAGFVRWVLHRRCRQVAELNPLLDGGGRFPHLKGSAVLHGQRRVSRAEWRRMHELVERLAVGVSLEPGPSARGDDLGTLASDALKDRLGRRAAQWREKISAEVIGRAMLAPFIVANARDAFRQRVALMSPPARRQRFNRVPWAAA